MPNVESGAEQRRGLRRSIKPSSARDLEVEFFICDVGVCVGRLRGLPIFPSTTHQRRRRRRLMFARFAASHRGDYSHKGPLKSVVSVCACACLGMGMCVHITRTRVDDEVTSCPTRTGARVRVFYFGCVIWYAADASFTRRTQRSVGRSAEADAVRTASA